MKIILYMAVYPGQTGGFFASDFQIPAPPGWTRYVLYIEVPDPIGNISKDIVLDATDKEIVSTGKILPFEKKIPEAVLWQLYHQFPDGTIKLCSQRELARIDHDQVSAWVKKTNEIYPIPKGAIWMLCNQESKFFWWEK